MRWPCNRKPRMGLLLFLLLPLVLGSFGHPVSANDQSKWTEKIRDACRAFLTEFGPETPAAERACDQFKARREEDLLIVSGDDGAVTNPPAVNAANPTPNAAFSARFIHSLLIPTGWLGGKEQDFSRVRFEG